MVFILCCLLAGQAAGSDEKNLRRYVVDLGDERAAVRDRAMTFLKDLPHDRAQELRNLRKTETDPERSERLSTVIRHLVGKEGEYLYQQGKLKDALLKLAEATGASDPQAEVERRTAAARDFIHSEFRRMEEAGKKVLYPPEQMKELREKHGRWALLPLIAALSGPHSHDAAQLIRRGLDADAIPALCGVLKGPDTPSTAGVCHLLGLLGGPEAIKTLRTVMEDSKRDEEIRTSARNALRELRVIQDNE